LFRFRTKQRDKQQDVKYKKELLKSSESVGNLSSFPIFKETRHKYLSFKRMI